MNHSYRPPCAPFTLQVLAVSVMMSFGAGSYAAPVGGAVAAGGASISTSGTKTTITQTTQNAAINWQSFGIAGGESVQFMQPNSSSVSLNRVVGPDASGIFGNLSSNGKVFLVNPNGILFGSGASVNVGGLVASTLNISDANFMAGRYSFNGAGSGEVLNQGTVNADGGYVALVAASVANQGVISARLGTVALAAGNAVTLDVMGGKLLNVTVDQGAVNALVQNGGLIRADGGLVLMTAQAAGNLLSTVVNNTGVIQAQTISSRNGTIKLLGDMQSGTMSVGGTLDASAPNGGDGGFIETSAANVRIHNSARVTTASALGRTGEWLIDPQDFTIGSGATDNISGATLSALLVTNSVVITTAPGPNATVAGTPPITSLNTATEANGDIHVNEAVSWTAAPSTTTLTLNATRDVNLNQSITAVNGNLVVCCGRDVNVNAAITTTNGSVLLSAGRNANVAAAMTTTDGNITVCAANDIVIRAPLTLTRGSSIPSQSLGLPLGLVLSAGNGGTGPGVGGGTVVFAPLTPPAAVTGPNAPVNIRYNPVSYTAPTDYSGNFTLTGGATLTQQMLVFAAGGGKTFDGTTATVLAGLKGNPAGVTLVAGPGSVANFDNPDVGIGKTISFTGYTLAGPNAAAFALPVACCGPVVAKTTGDIVPAPLPAPVVPVPVPLVTPQFSPFVVAPFLLRTPTTLLVVAPVAPAPVDLVVVQAETPPAPEAPRAATIEAPPAPYVPPVRPAKPFRN